MQRIISIVFSLVLVFEYFVSIALPKTANAEMDLSSRRNTTGITIYNQGTYKAANKNSTSDSNQGPWGLPGWANDLNQHRSLYTAGCNLFTYAHAVQWLTGEAAGNELLTALLGVCRNPSDKSNVAKCNHSNACVDTKYGTDHTADSAYQKYIKEEYGIQAKKISGSSKSEDALRQYFADGKVIHVNTAGHYALAVGMKKIGSTNYVHIVDSNWGTFKKKKLYEYYYIENEVAYPVAYTKDKEGYLRVKDYSYGCDYWLKYSDFDDFTWRYTLKRGTSNPPSADAIGDFDLVAEIQAVVTTRSDKGIAEYKLQKEPYAAAQTVKTVAPGADLTTTGVYKNKHSNYWLRFTDGTYLCANDVKLKTPVTAPETSGLVYPKGNLTFEKSFDLKGTITSKSTMPEVWAAVYKPDGGKIDDTSYAVTAKLENVKSVDIYTSALNKSSLGGISFSKLAKGDYYFTLWAYYYTYQDVEKTSENPLRRTQAVFLVDEPFTVGSGSSSTEEVNDAVDLCTLNAKFTYNKDANTHKLPYAASTKMGSVKAGQTVTVTKLVQNRYNNIWAQLSDGSYMCFYDKTTGEHHMTFLSTNELKVSDDVKKPTGDIPLATSFGLRGTITSDTPMLKVTAQVTNLATGKVAVGPAIASTVTGGILKSVTLNEAVNGTNINDIMSFKKLTTAGYYRYEVLVQLGYVYAYDGEVFKFGTEQVVISSDFTAGNPDEELVLPDVTAEPTPTATASPTPTARPTPTATSNPTSTPTPSPTPTARPTPTATSNPTSTPTPSPTPSPTVTPILVERIEIVYPADVFTYGHPFEYQWEVYPKNATNKEVTWTSSDENVLKLSRTANGMAIQYVNCGTTTITVSANDGSGVTESLYVTVYAQAKGDIQLASEIIVGEKTYGTFTVTSIPDWVTMEVICVDENFCRNENIASVTYTEESPGLYSLEVQGIAPGNTYVFVDLTYNGGIKAGFGRMTTVRDRVYVESMNFSGLPREMKVGETGVLCVIVAPTNHDCNGFRVFSSDESVLELLAEGTDIDENGNLYRPFIAHAPGTATITAIALDGSNISVSYTVTVYDNHLPGDANVDGSVNLSDAELVLHYAAGEDVQINVLNADVNSDGVVDICDALLLLQYDAGWNVTLK